MSSQFSLYIRKKSDEGKLIPANERSKTFYMEDEECDFNIKGICLFWLSTTPCRYLSGNVGSIEYTYNTMAEGYGYARPFTKDIYNDVVEFYKEKIDSYTKMKEAHINEMEELKNRILKINSVEIYEKIQDDIDTLKCSIREIEEEIEELKWILSKFEFAYSVLEDNQPYGKEPVYELLYSCD